MRKEATLEQWKELYELALQIKLMKPWEHLWDMDVLTLILPEYEQPFYFSVMGKGGQCYAIATYYGYDAVNEFYQLAAGSDIHFSQRIRYQNNMMCYFGDRKELTSKEIKLVKDLGYSFRGSNNWVYFHSFKTGYAPYILDAEQVKQEILVYKHLIEILQDIIDNKVKVDFEDGNTYVREYDKSKKKWIHSEKAMMLPPKEYMIPILEDDLLIAKLGKKKKIQAELELDVLYLNAVINDKKYERPILPKMCILADRNAGLLIDQEMLEPEDEVEQVVFGLVINYMMSEGRPKVIYVRDEYIRGILYDLCQRVKIPIEVEGTFEIIDDFLEELGNRGL